MKKIMAIFVIFLSACSVIPSDAAIQTAIAQTQTIGATLKIKPTLTPKPTNTSIPTNTPQPTPMFDSKMKTIDDSSWAISWKFPEVTLTSVSIKKKIGVFEADHGKTYMLVNLKMKNPIVFLDLTMSYGAWGFVASNTSGVIYKAQYLGEGCEMDTYMDVRAGGVLEGCVIFLVPDIGNVTLFYAPYENDRYGEGRYVQWEISY